MSTGQQIPSHAIQALHSLTVGPPMSLYARQVANGSLKRTDVKV